MLVQVRDPRFRSGAALRRGVFGGAFNPPHVAHLICAQEAWSQLDLDEVLMVPTGVAPHREITPEPGPELRVSLCEAAAEGIDWMRVSRAEVDRDGPSYMADTLALLREEQPDSELTLILGADQAASLRTWHQPERVVELATVAVAAREGVEREAVLGHLDDLGPVEFFDMPRIDVSSTMVRERVVAGRPLTFLVPDMVRAIVAERGLYRGAEVGAR